MYILLSLNSWARNPFGVCMAIFVYLFIENTLLKDNAASSECPLFLLKHPVLLKVKVCKGMLFPESGNSSRISWNSIQNKSEFRILSLEWLVLLGMEGRWVSTVFLKMHIAVLIRSSLSFYWKLLCPKFVCLFNEFPYYFLGADSKQ